MIFHAFLMFFNMIFSFSYFFFPNNLFLFFYILFLGFELLGTEKSLHAATVLLELHATYVNVWEQMETEELRLDNQLKGSCSKLKKNVKIRHIGRILHKFQYKITFFKFQFEFLRYLIFTKIVFFVDLKNQPYF